MVQIDYYFSLLSPFTYLAGDRLEVVAARHDAGIRYRPINIFDVFAETGGVPVGKRHPSRQAYRLQELRRGARKSGLPLNLQPAHWPTDAASASAAMIAVAEAGGDAGALARHFLRDCWARDRDIAAPEVIAAGLAAVGMTMVEIEGRLEAALKAFQANTRRAIDAGVFGAPFYIVGAERFWGHDRLGDLDAHLLDLDG